MVMDLTEPIPALVLTPRRLLRIAMFVGASGVAALLVAVGVLVWTYSGLEAGFAGADRTRRHVVEARCGRAGRSACTRARSRPGGGAPPLPLPPLHPPPVPTRRSCGTRPWPPSPRPPRPGRPRSPCRPRAPGFRHSDGPLARQQRAHRRLECRRPIARTAEPQRAGAALASGAGGGGGVPTGAIIGSATAIGTSVGNNAFDLLNTLILANSGFYGGRPTTGIPGVGLPDPGAGGRSSGRGAVGGPAQAACRSADTGARNAETAAAAEDRSTEDRRAQVAWDRHRCARHTDRHRILSTDAAKEPAPASAGFHSSRTGPSTGLKKSRVGATLTRRADRRPEGRGKCWGAI